MKYAITVIKGEAGGEHAEALYQEALNAIDTSRFDVETITVSPDGVWKRNDKEVEPEKALLWADYVWIAGFGPGIEDGALQRILDEHRVPYNGSDVVLSRICAHKSACKDLLEHKGIKTPVWSKYDISGEVAEGLANDIFTAIPQPCVIKSDTWQEGAAVYRCQTQAQIRDALIELAATTDCVVAEEYIGGTPVVVGVIRDIRDQAVYVLPPVQIDLEVDALFAAQMAPGDNHLLCPARMNKTDAQAVANRAEQVHVDLELGDYSRIDMVVHPSRGIFVLDVNTIPGYAATSALWCAMEEVGITVKELMNVCIEKKLS